MSLIIPRNTIQQTEAVFVITGNGFITLGVAILTSTLAKVKLMFLNTWYVLRVALNLIFFVAF